MQYLKYLIGFIIGGSLALCSYLFGDALGRASSDRISFGQNFFSYNTQMIMGAGLLLSLFLNLILLWTP